jgi:3-mercaptopyruvate sulfurtransferase SseA
MMRSILSLLVCVWNCANAGQLPSVKWANDEQVNDIVLNRSSLTIIDTRNPNEFNGWILKNLDHYGKVGHLNGSFNFDVDWLDIFQPDLIDNYLTEFLNLTSKSRLKNLLVEQEQASIKTTRILLYDTSVKRLEKLRAYLLNNYVTSAIYMYQLRHFGSSMKNLFHLELNYDLIVPPEYIYDLLYNSSNAQRFKIFDVSDGDDNKYYTKGHIPKSIHLDTNEFEEPPFWTRKNRVELSRLLLSIGIRQNNSEVIVLYGNPDTVAAFRVAVIMKWMGVQNVRVLNGGYKAWFRKNFPIERLNNKRQPEKSIWLSDDLFLRSNYIVDIDFVLDFVRNYDLFKSHYSLIDLRSFAEFTGNTSDSVRGRIPNAIWGNSMYFKDDETTSLYNYRNPDSTVRSLDDIRHMWDHLGIDYGKKHLVFYSGGGQSNHVFSNFENICTFLTCMWLVGWKASEVLYYAELMGLKKISIYDGGWTEWSKNGKNQIETGVPKSLSSYADTRRKFKTPNSATSIKAKFFATVVSIVSIVISSFT